MPESHVKPKVLLSDPHVLRKIKFMQFSRQLIPLLVIVFLMGLNIFWTKQVILYLVIASFGWYLVEKLLFRTKAKILTPEPGAFVSPVDGKVLSIKRSPDTTVITIHKSVLDVVELRLPYQGLISESAGNWTFETPAGQIGVRIKSNKVKYFEDRNIHGSVIGVIYGSAKITIYLPSKIEILIKEKQNLFGGETEITSFAEKEAEKPKSILVEEPISEIS